MKRRNFLKLCSAIPFIGLVKPEAEDNLYIFETMEDKDDWFDDLYEVVNKVGEKNIEKIILSTPVWLELERKRSFYYNPKVSEPMYIYFRGIRCEICSDLEYGYLIKCKEGYERII